MSIKLKREEYEQLNISTKKILKLVGFYYSS